MDGNENRQTIEPAGEATISVVDGWIRFWPDARLSEDDYRATVSIGLRWKRIDKAFAGPWTPAREDFLRLRFGVAAQWDDPDDPSVDLMAQAEARAETYNNFADNAGTRASSAYGRAKEIADAIPLGQPILVGHHSEQQHRRDLERIDTAMRKSITEGAKADNWAERARATVAKAARRERPDAIQRRIKELEVERRKYEKASHKRWLNFLDWRLGYERALLEAMGGLVADELVFEAGGAVRTRVWGWEEIIKKNAKSVSVKRVAGLREGAWWRETRPLEDILEEMSAADWQTAQEKMSASM